MQGLQLWPCVKMVIAGIVMGYTSRVMLVGTMSHDRILPSLLGLMAFVVISFAVGGILMAIQNKLYLLVPIGLCLLSAGIMWVIPYPS